MTDKELKNAVLRELEAAETVDATHIGVVVKDRAVTLTGHAGSYGEKWAAVAAAERVYGVRAVADELAVDPLGSVLDDQSLAEEIGRRLSADAAVPESVMADVRDGRVILRGEVETAFQKEEAERVVSGITGIVAISNTIEVDPNARSTEIHNRIEEALTHEAALDARQIEVITYDDTVVLRGAVRAHWEKETAERAAAAAPGVSKLESRLAVVS